MSPRAARIRRIRVASWTAGLALLAVAWLVLFVQLAQGNDPVLRNRRAAAVQPAPQAAAPPAAQQPPAIIDPQQSGQSIDPQTGLPIDPQTGLPIDPRTGQPADPRQQAAVDPNAGGPTPAPLTTRQS